MTARKAARKSWDDPRVLRIGKKYAAEAYDLADYLNTRGADATALVMTDDEQAELAERRDDQVTLPVHFADVVMAVLLAMPRKGKRGRRRIWSPDEAQSRVDHGEPKSKIARDVSKQTGLKMESIRAQLRGKKVGKKTPGLFKHKKSTD
jgi:hypothetical protein